MFGKQTETAIAAMTCLAAIWDDPAARVSSRHIAERRGLQAPIVAKVLSALAQAGLVAGTPGPGGGYRLSRPPDQIALKDVAAVFERGQTNPAHAFACEVLGGEPPPTVRRRLTRLAEALDELLSQTTVDTLCVRPGAHT
jgi:Rrf2 family protein